MGFAMATTENKIEQELVSKLEKLKYVYRSDIRDGASLEVNFPEKLIVTQSQKIDVLKTDKKGLVQQLFPVLDGGRG